MDTTSKDYFYKEVMTTEIEQLQSSGTSKGSEEGQNISQSYKRTPCHCFYDVKIDGRRKCRLN